MIFKDKQLIKKMQSDAIFLNEVMQMNDTSKLIKYVIKNYTKNPALFMQQHKIEWEDLYQVCLIGLYNGICKLDLSKSVPEILSFLYINIKGEIRNYARSNQSNSIVITQKIRLMYPLYLKFYHDFRLEFHKDPNIHDTMKHFDISRDQAFDLVYGMQNVVSIYQTGLKNSVEKAKIYNHDQKAKSVEQIVIEKILIEYFMNFLTIRERKIIHLYFFLGYSKSEIAKIINCGNSTVTRNLDRVVAVLKTKLKA